MARPLRLEFPGALWHVTARGNAREAVFLDDGDRQGFLDLVGKVAGTYQWRLHAWVIMGNHYHLVVETPEPTLSRGMRQINGVYTQRFNARHGRVGHLFQGRFKAVLVERQSHLLELVRYVVLNPVRAGLAERASAYRWSSYRATAGLEPPPSWLDVSWLLSNFDETSPRRAERRWVAFVAEGTAGAYRPWAQVVGQLYLGTDEFVADVAGKLASPAASREHPRVQREAGRAGLPELLAAVTEEFGTTAEVVRRHRRGPARKALALVGRVDLGLHLKALAPVVGVTEWSISNLAATGERLVHADPAFAAKVAAIRRRLALPSGTQ